MFNPSATLKQDISISFPDIHKTRLDTLFTFVEAGCRTQNVTVTSLGRALKGASGTDVKHDVKRADRLIGNTYLHQEKVYFYQLMSERLLGHQKHPLILVDWSPINGAEIFQVLRASIPMDGRALTIYEKAYPESELNTDKAHREFIEELSYCLPEGCQPIIVTDAGFKSPWFEAIEKKNWFWLGRVRGQVQLSEDKCNWSKCKQWYESATNRAKKTGKIFYSKKNQLACEGVLYHGSTKGRYVKKKRGGQSQCSTNKYQQQKAKEPLFLVYHLPENVQYTAKRIVQIYKKRMQIEENFRDTKNQRLGLGISDACSKSSFRYDILLLVAALILFVLWCIGYASCQLGQARLLQANSTKHRRVLSIIFVGRQVVNDGRYCPDEPLLIYVYHHLSEIVKVFTKKL
jgi:hypothetical protein